MRLDRFLYINKGLVSADELLYGINRAGSGDVGGDFRIERNSSYPYCVIHFVAKGSGEVVHRGKKHTVTQGQCFVLNPFEGHVYQADPKEPFYLNWVEFSGGDSARLIGAFLNSSPPIVNEFQSSRINKYMLKIFKYLKNDDCSREIHISKVIYSILVHLLSQCKSEMYTKLPESRIRDIQKVIKYIDDNIKESLTMQSLSRIINYNPQYFSKLFKRYTGVTPARYILDKRLNKAKDELHSSDVQIDLLADKLGFCDASHFIRKFKKAEGMTPAEFRKESISYYKKNRG